jgi:hypothetical protein
VKSGLEQRGKVIFAVILGLIALFALARTLERQPGATGPSPSPSTTKANAPQAAQAKRRPRPGSQPDTKKERSLDPTLRFDYLLSEKVEYKGGKRNIFSMQSEPVEVARVKQPPPPHCPDANDPRCAPPPPNCAPGAAPDPRCPPPPIPLQFFGFASRPGEPKRVFLRTTDTNDVFVAGEGEVVNRRFRVLRIMGSGVEVEDVLNNNKQVLPLQQGG